MAASAIESDNAPMMDINTTPLIDVMLVLLIMFIITIPIQTHAVRIDLPQNPPKRILVDPVKNKIVVDAAGALLWNGTKIELASLPGLLARGEAMTPKPELHIQPQADARYERVNEVLAVTKRVGVEKMGFVGNERYRKF